MAATDRLKKLGKQVIDYPEDAVPVISTKDWVKHVAQDPTRKVRISHPYTPFLLILVCRLSIMYQACSPSSGGYIAIVCRIAEYRSSA